MPFDEKVAAVLSALGPQLDVFKFAASSTLERATSMLTADSGPTQAGAALGNFASGRIDPTRFAMISAGAAPLDSAGREAVEKCVEILEKIISRGSEDHVVDVPPEVSAATMVRMRLEKLGSVFGASSIIELVRRRVYDPAVHTLPVDGYPFRKWTAGERRIAPPLVVNVDGADLDAFDFGSLLDGCVRFALIVEGKCAPAPLARLISPGVFVAQTDDAAIFSKLTDLDAPAIVAVMSGPEARFVHDPRAGTAVWQRLQVSNFPKAAPRKAVGNRSGWQQRDDLAHLDSLAKQPLPLAPLIDDITPTLAAANADPAERLAAWLLDQSNLTGVN